jgi:hypothetical protein
VSYARLDVGYTVCLWNRPWVEEYLAFGPAAAGSIKLVYPLSEAFVKMCNCVEP